MTARAVRTLIFKINHLPERIRQGGIAGWRTPPFPALRLSWLFPCQK
jgi:hypothetical protein